MSFDAVYTGSWSCLMDSSDTQLATVSSRGSHDIRGLRKRFLVINHTVDLFSETILAPESLCQVQSVKHIMINWLCNLYAWLYPLKHLLHSTSLRCDCAPGTPPSIPAKNFLGCKLKEGLKCLRDLKLSWCVDCCTFSIADADALIPDANG